MKNPNESEVLQGIKLANTLRQASAVEELYYSPSIRETIAFAKLLESGVSTKESVKDCLWKCLLPMGKCRISKSK